MPRGLDFDELFANEKFLKAGEFQGKDVTLTISGVRRETFETEDENGKKGKTEKKAILSFAPTAAGRPPPKEIVLNKTNGLCLKAMFGRDTGAWIGKRVTFFPTLVKAWGAQELAIRVRGSPDIAQNFTFKLKLPRKKDIPTTMTKTEPKAKQSAAPTPAPAPSPSPQPDTRSPADYAPEAEPPPPGDEDAPGGGQ